LLIPNSNPGQHHLGLLVALRAGRRLSIGTAGVPIGTYTRQLLRRMRLSRDPHRQHRQPADQRGPVFLPGRARRGRRWLRLLHRRPGCARPHEDAQPAQVGPAAGVRYQICTVRRSGADTPARRAFIKQVTGKAGRGALKGLRLRVCRRAR
jgi:molybdate transport system substrate-binding protein